MTMLEILKARLPEGLTISSCKETSAKYRIELEYDGTRTKTELPKVCTPGNQYKVADFTISAAMTSIMIDRGDFQSAKTWSDKNMMRGQAEGCSDSEIAAGVDDTAMRGRYYTIRSKDDSCGLGGNVESVEKAISLITAQAACRKECGQTSEEEWIIVLTEWQRACDSSGMLRSESISRRTVGIYEKGKLTEL